MDQKLFWAVDAQFLPNTVADPEYPSKTGKRNDGANLIDEWLSCAPDEYVWNRQDFWP